MDRFWSKVDKESDGFAPAACWLWTASGTTAGYGTFRLDGKKTLAHRLSYELCVGPIPDNLVIDHLCGNARCVNPCHLEPVTQGENVRRGWARRPSTDRPYARCGHPLFGENLRVLPSGYSVCVQCARAANRRSYRKRVDRASENQ